MKDANDERSADKQNEEYEERRYDSDGYLCGETGCGLCALYRLRKAGITHLKLVGRGNYVDFMEKDIRNLKTALDILEHGYGRGIYQGHKTNIVSVWMQRTVLL